MSVKADMRLADALRGARERLGLSQREVSKAAGISNTTISRLERGSITADPDTLKALASTLGLDYLWLLTLNGTIEDQPEIRQMARAMKRMSSEERQKMLDLLERRFRYAFALAGSDTGCRTS